jgi:WD40 repeat protein
MNETPLPAAGAASAALRLEEACDQFEAAWRAGSPPRLEDFLAGASAAEWPALLRELVQLDAYHRRRRGQAARPADYRARFPELDPAWLADVAAGEGDRPETVPYQGPAAVGAVVAGRYKLLQVIGEGGMGSVFMAEQTQPVKRMVAVKVVKAGMDSKTVLARFEAERQALALMDHPHIAKVLDAGTTEHGQPFFVMELVKGVPLTPFCDERQLSVRDRLQIFQQVCHAVQHAHQKGIIHRDLKPSNILVESHDGRPVPKVIDFGLAKAVHALPLTERSLFTQFGALLGTPLYMAPEQAEFSAIDVDTRADVYALGVILYELLTGTTPLEKKRLAEAAWEEVRRVIKEEEPPTPSARLSTSATRASVAAQRQTEPHKLGKFVRGDLDWVVMKALAKERDRRYATANALAADVARFLNHEPVQAGPPTVGYKLRKFVRRHRGPVVAGVAIAALLVLGVAVSTWQAVRATRAEAGTRDALEAEAQQRAEAEHQQGIARVEAEKATRLAADERRAREEGRRNLYVANLRLAQQAWEGAQVDYMLRLLEDAARRQPGDEDLRGFEWHYLWRLGNPEVQTIRGHTHGIHAVAFSPDGRRLASGSWDCMVKLWEVATGKELLTLRGHQGGIAGVAFSRDGKHLASADGVHLVKLWDPATGKLRFTLKGHADRVSGVAFSPDGRHLASASWDGRVKVWEVATGKELLTLQAHRTHVHGVAFSPDGRHLASADGDRAVRLWDAATGLEVRSFKGHRGGVMSVAFSPDGRSLASASADKAVKLWETATGKELFTLLGHSGSVTAVAFRPDGKGLASASHDRTVRTWEADTGKEVRALKGYPTGVVALAYSPDGQRLASANGDQAIQLWDTAGGNEVLTLRGHSGLLDGLAFSPDGRRLASCGLDCTVKLWEAASGVELRTLKGHTKRAHTVAFSPDGRRLASSSHDQTVKLWEAASGKEVATLRGHTGDVHGVAFSPDGRLLASAGKDGMVRLWDTSTAKELRTLKGHVKHVNGVAFSPDGRRLASSGLDKTVRIWRTSDGKEILRLQGHTGTVGGVAFSPDGRFLASSSYDRSVRVWDTEGGRLLFPLWGHTGRVLGVAFSPDGRRLASAGEDGTVRIWEALSGTELLALKGLSRPPNRVAFSPDGESVAAACFDGTVRVWESVPRPPEARRQRELRLRALDLVESLFLTHVHRGDVLQALRDDATLTGALRQAALAEAGQYRPSPKALNDACWAVVRQPGGSPAACRQAVRQAEEACRIEPEHWAFVDTLGVAQYRVGQYAAAVETLTRAERLQATRETGPIPSTLAFLAMSQYQLGQKRQARATRGRLREALTRPAWATDPEAPRFLLEAVLLMEGEAPAQ